MKLNDKKVVAMAVEVGKTERVEWDDDLRGFGLRLRADGRKTWVVQYRDQGGASRKLTLGPIQTIGADKARKLAKEALARAHLGQDPQAQKFEARKKASETFKVFVARYLAHRKKQDLKGRSLEEVERHLTKHWSPFSSRSVHAIDRRAVSAQFGVLEEERGGGSPRTARGRRCEGFSRGQSARGSSTPIPSPAARNGMRTGARARAQRRRDRRCLEGLP